MRGKLVLIVVSVVMFFTPLASGRVQAIWTVVTNGEVDGRIQRQLHALASQNGVRLRFSGDAPQNARSQRDASGLQFQLESVADARTFLAELKQQARGSEIQPTAELANQGYILRCLYLRGAATRNIRPLSHSH